MAPIKIGKGATIAAGSTITKDAPPGDLTVSRSKQTSISGWTKPTNYKGIFIMGTQTFGGTSYTLDPNGVSIILKPALSYSVVETYEGAAFFSWGTSIKGRKCVLKWDGMSVTQYNQFQAVL